MARLGAPWALAAVAALGLLPMLMGQGCAPNPPADQPGDQAADQPAQVQAVSPADAQALIENHQSDPNFVIIDVRTPTEFAGGHIANAVNVCVQGCATPFADAIGGFDKSKTYLVYCGSHHRSPTATATMIDRGFTHVYDMLGGLSQWQSEGRPVVP